MLLQRKNDRREASATSWVIAHQLPAFAEQIAITDLHAGDADSSEDQARRVEVVGNRTAAAGDSGEFYTPRAVVRFMVEVIDTVALTIEDTHDFIAHHKRNCQL